MSTWSWKFKSQWILSIFLKLKCETPKKLHKVIFKFFISFISSFLRHIIFARLTFTLPSNFSCQKSLRLELSQPLPAIFHLDCFFLSFLVGAATHKLSRQWKISIFHLFFRCCWCRQTLRKIQISHQHEKNV